MGGYRYLKKLGWAEKYLYLKKYRYLKKIPVPEKYRYRYLKNLVGPKKVPVPEKTLVRGKRISLRNLAPNTDIPRLQKCFYYRG